MTKPSVLLVDDEEAIFKVIQRKLRPEFDVKWASTVQEALEIIETAQSDFDVAVVDMRLGQDWEGGLKAIHALRSLDPAPETIVFTAFGSPENMVKCMEAGAFSYVEKPGSTVNGGVTDELKAKIHHAVEARAVNEKQTAEQVLESFHGKVERIEGDVAHVTLIDSKGREAFADCDAVDLVRQGIEEGSHFSCIIKKRGEETVMTFEPIPRREFSDEEWSRLSERLEKNFGDWNPQDDY